MKVVQVVSVIILSLALATGLQSESAAGQGGAESLTLTIDRNVMPVSLFHAGLFWTEPETVTVFDFAIRNYFGDPIDGFWIQTASARTKLPIETVREIRQTGWICKNTEDIKGIKYVVPVQMVLTDGTELDALMNADFGTIEGRTDLGKFFVSDPHTVTYLAFNRPGFTPEPKLIDQPGQPAILDSDGDGVPDEVDRCPDTPAGVAVDEFGCPLDSDGDGVADYMDECPDTPAGAAVNSIGCWIIKGINFDYNKWDIKPQYYEVLDANVEILKKNPALKIEVQGHTDSIASEAYNQGLSEKRAAAALQYMTGKGIGEGTITMSGFGESRPIASNDTAEGRAENRRIEIKIISR